jgi:putative transposase
MPRLPRIDFPDALYHVIARGNGRAAIFWTDADRRRFLRQLADGVQTAAVV